MAEITAKSHIANEVCDISPEKDVNNKNIHKEVTNLLLDKGTKDSNNINNKNEPNKNEPNKNEPNKSEPNKSDKTQKLLKSLDQLDITKKDEVKKTKLEKLDDNDFIEEVDLILNIMHKKVEQWCNNSKELKTFEETTKRLKFVNNIISIAKKFDKVNSQIKNIYNNAAANHNTLLNNYTKVIEDSTAISPTFDVLSNPETNTAFIPYSKDESQDENKSKNKNDKEYLSYRDATSKNIDRSTSSSMLAVTSPQNIDTPQYPNSPTSSKCWADYGNDEPFSPNPITSQDNLTYKWTKAHINYGHTLHIRTVNKLNEIRYEDRHILFYVREIRQVTMLLDNDKYINCGIGDITKDNRRVQHCFHGPNCRDGDNCNYYHDPILVPGSCHSANRNFNYNVSVRKPRDQEYTHKFGFGRSSRDDLFKYGYEDALTLYQHAFQLIAIALSHSRINTEDQNHMYKE